MRVGLDVTALVAGNTGIARYARMHLAGLEVHTDIETFPFAVGRGPDPGLALRRVRVPLRIVQRSWRHLGIPRAEWIVGNLDVVHSVDIVPPPSRRPLVVTVHDVLPLVIPDRYAPRQRMMVRAQLRRAATADLVVADCEASAAEIVEHTNISRDRVLVARLGRRPESDSIPDSDIAEPFVLAVGALTPRKGFHHLIEAMRLLGPSAPLLVLAGPDGWRSEVIRRRIADLGLGDRVAVLGYVDDRRLEGLYRHAQLVCHPSEAEGFGIPVLEAMGFGTPVVATDIPPVREIGGDAVRLVPPNDPVALADAIGEVLTNSNLRQELSDLGRRRAAPLTWQAMTDCIVDGYRRVTD